MSKNTLNAMTIGLAALLGFGYIAPVLSWYTVERQGDRARVISVDFIPGESRVICRAEYMGSVGSVFRASVQYHMGNRDAIQYVGYGPGPGGEVVLPYDDKLTSWSSEHCLKLDAQVINSSIRDALRDAGKILPLGITVPALYMEISGKVKDRGFVRWYIRMNGDPNFVVPTPPPAKCSAWINDDIAFGSLLESDVAGASGSTDLSILCDRDATATAWFVGPTGAGEISLRPDIIGTLKMGAWPGEGGWTFKARKDIPYTIPPGVVLRTIGTVAPGVFRGVAVIKIEIQ